MEKYTVKIIEEGTIKWYQNDKLHLIGGPAIEYADGSKAWYQEGKRHRLDGPAIERPDGSKEWYINGKEYSQDGFDEFTKTKIKELTVKEICSLLGYEVKIVGK
jgi:hypothetical protein